MDFMHFLVVLFPFSSLSHSISLFQKNSGFRFLRFPLKSSAFPAAETMLICIYIRIHLLGLWILHHAFFCSTFKEIWLTLHTLLQHSRNGSSWWNNDIIRNQRNRHIHKWKVRSSAAKHVASFQSSERKPSSWQDCPNSKPKNSENSSARFKAT